MNQAINHVAQQDWDTIGQSRLDALPGSENNIFTDSAWTFSIGDSPTIEIDFTIIDEMIDQNPQWADNMGFDITTATKLAWLAAASQFASSKWRIRLAGLALFWSALLELSIVKLTLQNFKEVLAFLLTHRWTGNRCIQSKEVISHAHFVSLYSITVWRSAFNSFSSELISWSITARHQEKLLKSLIPELTNNSTTGPDWMVGESLDLLTLDYGQYYVEHCKTFFEDHVALATAINCTYDMVPEFAISCGLTTSTVSKVVPRLLEGISPYELHERELLKHNRIRLDTLCKLHREVYQHFITIYRGELFLSLMLRDESIETFISSLAIRLSHDQIDRFRVIIFYYLTGRSNAIPELLKNCIPSVETADFVSLMNFWKEKYFYNTTEIPKKNFYRDIGIFEPDTAYDAFNRQPRKLARLVEDAGLTTIVALTGWRRSEYGFPFAAVLHEPNNDKLDQYAFPYRTFVDWYIPKTHGPVPEKRDVTFYVALLCERMRILIDSHTDEPCLYSTAVCKDIFDSGTHVKLSVCGLWGHFVKNYPGFILIDDLKIWEMIAENHSTNNAQFREYLDFERHRLLELRPADEWDNLSIDINLRIACERARREWPAIEFSFLYSYNSEKKDWLKQYRDGNLREDWSTLLSTLLSEETQTWIKGLSDGDCSDASVTKDIMKEFLESVLYPTPHALRHMFAEAMLRRFDGDLGWLLRSSFKHISQSQWLSYVRNKDNRKLNSSAKHHVISSLVQNFVMKAGENYAGQMSKWLRRIMRKTTLMSFEEKAEFANRIAATEISDVKANPWGYCLLKKRTRPKAKCAELGEPQRHNASPELCMDCVHALMKSENVDWVIVHIQSHMDVLRSPIVPSIFKGPSFKLLKSAARHIQSLNPGHMALAELNDVIKFHREASQ